MSDNSEEVTATAAARRQRTWSGWRVLGWVLLGMLAGVSLMVLFVSYGQPELLLEQINLRYCG